MILPGPAVRRVSVEHYAAYYIGYYRCKRDEQLAWARAGYEVEDAVVMAREAHRNMMRCVREMRREEAV